MPNPLESQSILFIHMRKAGGTSARAFLGRYAERHGLKLDATEGRAVDFASIAETTFVVANFRHPIDRLWSLYQVEASRYARREGRDTPPFEEWLSTPGLRQHARAPELWREPSNYYVRVLGGEQRSNSVAQPELSEADYRAAITNLQRLDLIMITDWVRHEGYVSHLHSVLNQGQCTLQPYPHYNARAKPAEDANPPKPTKEQYQLASALNRWDVELYRYACWRAAGDAGLDLENMTEKPGVTPAED